MFNFNWGQYSTLYSVSEYPVISMLHLADNSNLKEFTRGYINNMKGWNAPKDLSELIFTSEDSIWEDDSLEPILISVMAETTYAGRDIALAWQIEFEPRGVEFQRTNQILTAQNTTPDGYGWGALINTIFQKYHPDMLNKLHFGDCEESCCVIWSESEQIFKQLIEVVLNLTDLESNSNE